MWRLVTDTGGVGGPLLIGRLAEAFSLGLATWVTAAIGAAGLLILFHRRSRDARYTRRSAALSNRFSGTVAADARRSVSTPSHPGGTASDAG